MPETVAEYVERRRLAKLAGVAFEEVKPPEPEWVQSMTRGAYKSKVSLDELAVALPDDQSKTL